MPSTTMATTMVAGMKPDNSATRIHSRYDERAAEATRAFERTHTKSPM